MSLPSRKSASAATPRLVGGGDGTVHAIVALCAGQGFAGTFSEHVLDSGGEMLRAAKANEIQLMVIGDRGLMLAAEQNLAVEWSAPMIAHVGEVTPLADRIVEALYERLERGLVSRVTLIYTELAPSGQLDVVRRQLIPFDYGHFSPARSAPPLITLPPRLLLAQLAEEYVFTEICEALTISFAAENEARTHSMVAAKANVGKTLDGLVSLSRQLRQEEITNEIVELSAGQSWARSLRSRPFKPSRAGGSHSPISKNGWICRCCRAA